MPQFKNDRFIFLVSERKAMHFLDLAKVADIICPILTTKQVDIKRFREDPFASGSAFDELSLSMITWLRAQGHGAIIPLIQDLDKVSNTQKRNEIRKLYRRFLESEFPETKPISLEKPQDLLKLLLELQRAPIMNFSHQKDRGYMIAEGVKFAADGVQGPDGTQYVDIWGVAKGTGFSSDEHVHVTGYGDLEIVGMAASWSKQALEMKEDVMAGGAGADKMAQEGAFRKDKNLVNKFGVFRKAEAADDFNLFITQKHELAKLQEESMNQDVRMTEFKNKIIKKADFKT